MPPEAATVAGRCYCGASRLNARAAPITVAYCHCTDCRRWTGAPVAAFAAFDKETVQITPDPGDGRSHAPGVTRWVCDSCGSPLAATFDYLPGQIYVPLGILDTADDLPPELHCHSHSALPWLHIQDNLPRACASGRDTLQSEKP